jgi:archaellum biogenesis ATPase FlaH
MNFEQVLINNLVYNDEFTRKVLPYIKDEYFHDKAERAVHELVQEHYEKYNTAPTVRALLVELGNKSGLGEDVFRSAQDLIQALDKSAIESQDWLLESTEKFCQEKAMYNAVRKAIEILDDPKDGESPGSLPELFTNALSVGFDTDIGHDYLDNFEERFLAYRQKVNKIPFGIELLNHITKGGLGHKTLNIILAGTNVGKSLIMCDWAATNLSMGYNVLYITLEMSEIEVSKRIDGNLLDIELDDLENIDLAVLKKKADKVREKARSKLIVKEFPTASANTNHFRHLLNELRLKKNFKPDIIYVDYLNICASARLKNANNVNSYTYIKAIAEELRGLAVEFGVPLVSATQTTRGGYESSDLDLTDTSESFGLPATADLMLGVVETEELMELGQYLFKQLKNRYADKNKCKRFVIGVHKSKMRLHDVEQEAQEDILDGPVMDRGEIGRRSAEEAGFKRPEKPYPGVEKFNGFK